MADLLTAPVCVIPWFYTVLAWNQFGVCCNSYDNDFEMISEMPVDFNFKTQVFNHDNYISMRKGLSTGELSDFCKRCNHASNFGTLSHRQNFLLKQLLQIEDKEQQTRAMQNYNKCVESIQNGISSVECSPCYAVVSCGSTCNLKCKFCYNRNTNYDPNPEHILNVIDKIHSSLIACQITGGEVFFTRAGKAILKRFGEGVYKFGVRLGTNAQTVDFDLLKPVNLTSLQISTDAATKQTYEKVRVGGSFERLIENIKKFAELKKSKPLMEITTNYTITADNFSEIPAAIKLFEDLGTVCQFNLVYAEKDDPQNIRYRTDLHDDFFLSIEKGIKCAENKQTIADLVHIKNTIIIT